MNQIRRLMSHWNVILPQALRKIADIIGDDWQYFQYFKSEESMMTAVFKLVVQKKRFVDGWWINIETGEMEKRKGVRTHGR